MHTSTHSIPGKRIFCMILRDLADLTVSYFHTVLRKFDPCDRKITWTREQLPTPVFWPRVYHGPYSPWGPKESDMTEQLSLF